MNNPANKDTLPFDPTAETPVVMEQVLDVEVAGLSHQGLVRPNNEDHFLVARVGRFLETVDTNLEPKDVPPHYQEAGYAMVTADGLGGHAAGQEASRLAIKYLVDLLIATPDWILRLKDESDAERIVQRTIERFEQTNQALTEVAERKPKLHGFGTTVTLAALLSDALFVFHVGDSRAYLLRQGRLHQLTHDHTRGQELFDAGIIKQSDLATHQWRNVLTKLLGDQVTDAKPDVQRLAVNQGDVLLLCTDGLTEMVDDAKITEILQSKSSADEICKRLVDDALAAGGKDNVTVIVARLRNT